MSSTESSEPIALPPYLREHWSTKKRKSFFRFEPSTKLRQQGFPIKAMRLGTDLDVALKKYNREIRPKLDEWRKRNTLVLRIDAEPIFGSLRWAFGEYAQKDRFLVQTKLSRQTMTRAVGRCCRHVMQEGEFSGTKFGDIPLLEMTYDVADQFYEEYLVTRTSANGVVEFKHRSGGAKGDIEYLRTVINGIWRKHHARLYREENVFAGLHASHKPKPPVPVNAAQLAAFVQEADRRGRKSISAIVMYAWEMMARPTHFPYHMTLEHYRCRFHEDEVWVLSEKTDVSMWFILFNDEREALYPNLTPRLDELKGDRTLGHLFISELSEPGNPKPWSSKGLASEMAEICKSAGLPNLTLGQFRRGGMNESGTAGNANQALKSQTMHKTDSALGRYFELNAERAAEAQEKRLSYRHRKARSGKTIVV